MTRAVRTGFGWERDTSAPFIHVSWDYRRGASIAPKVAFGRLAAIAINLAAWGLIIVAMRGCGGGFA